MPAAANSLKAPTTSEAGPAAKATPGAEIFAALMSGTETVTAQGESAEAVTSEVTIEATTEATTEVSAEVQPNLDILAPLLAQQQVVPTVTVPNVAGEAAPAAADTAAIAIAGSVLNPALAPSEVDGRLKAPSNPNPPPATMETTGAVDKILADASRLRPGPAVVEGLPQPVDAGETKGSEVKAALVEVAKALGKTEAPASQPATAPTISASAPSAANDQQRGSGRQQTEAPVVTIETPAQQPTSSVTDVRSLIASLTATGIAGAGGPAQAGAAQQLGQALAAQVLNLAGGSEWLDQLAQEIGRATEGSGPLRFRLTPESLGELKVEISQSDRGAVVRMTVATEAAQAALADAQPRLAAEARAQGVRIADTQVNLAGNQAQQHQQGRESARQQSAGDQPLRAFRAAASTSTGTSASAATSRSAERYA